MPSRSRTVSQGMPRHVPAESLVRAVAKARTPRRLSWRPVWALQGALDRLL